MLGRGAADSDGATGQVGGAPGSLEPPHKAISRVVSGPGHPGWGRWVPEL